MNESLKICEHCPYYNHDKWWIDAELTTLWGGCKAIQFYAGVDDDRKENSCFIGTVSVERWNADTPMKFFKIEQDDERKMEVIMRNLTFQDIVNMLEYLDEWFTPDDSDHCPFYAEHLVTSLNAREENIDGK